MPRIRVLLALLLAATWCSAAWHVELEAIGLVQNHEHRAHDGHEQHDHPEALHDHHEPLFARNLTKDVQFRVSASGLLANVNFAHIRGFSTVPCPLFADTTVSLGGNPSDPPWVHVWRFARRCAPDSAAPPALS